MRSLVFLFFHWHISPAKIAAAAGPSAVASAKFPPPSFVAVLVAFVVARLLLLLLSVANTAGTCRPCLPGLGHRKLNGID